MRYLTTILILIISSGLNAASVKKKINKKKMVIIDEGSSDGVARGSKVCFYKSSGKKITCGRVKKIKKTRAYVKVKSKYLKRIKKGYEARIKSSGSGSRGKKSGLGIYAMGKYILTPMSSTSYSKMLYQTPFSGEKVDTLWANKGSGGTSYVGFSGEVGYFLAIAYLAAGFKYKMIVPSEINSDYGDDNANYAVTRTSASSMGFYFDALYPVYSTKMLDLHLGAGLDIDMSSVQVLSNQRSDNDSSLDLFLYQIDSSGMIISARLRGDLSYRVMKNINLTAGAVALIGIMGSPSASVEHDDPQSSSLNEAYTVEEDATLALAHKSAIGVELTLGVSYHL